MDQMRAAPQLTASGLTGDYRLLADFNDIVLVEHPIKYGVQFVTWERVQNRTALYQGNYHEPSADVDGYAAAKQNFVTCSGLISRSTQKSAFLGMHWQALDLSRIVIDLFCGAGEW